LLFLPISWPVETLARRWGSAISVAKIQSFFRSGEPYLDLLECRVAQISDSALWGGHTGPLMRQFGQKPAPAT